ncbi:MAG: acyl-CoA dehydrogenase family protein [Microthrixaceae bacterium]|nr:acyl-CoA dehydrogenase family protein [Microthrixaceae bacterium]
MDSSGDTVGTTDPDALEVQEATERLLAEFDPDTTGETEFLGAQYDAGLAWVHFPRGLGGLGVNPRLQALATGRITEAGGPLGGLRNPIGYGMCGPAVEVHGTDEQRALLRPLFTNEHIWCQLFSEPGAGSDVASLATRAERDGEEWVVNGQKVWTTLAHVSSYGLLIARSDPEVPKHRGMTAFIVDMRAPGVETRPLRQMTGDAEFNEVYFTDVRIPDSMRLDEVGRGWSVAITTLMNERVSIGAGTGAPPRGSGPIRQLVDAYSAHGSTDEVMRDRVVQLWARSEVNRLTNMRAAANRKLGTPGPEGSVAKLAMAELNKDIYEATTDLAGADGMLYGSYDEPTSKSALFGDDLAANFLRARANSIEGGTSEVLRNILGERVLGLPGDVRADKDLPWSDVPRS